MDGDAVEMRMQNNGYQIYIRHVDVERVIKTISEYVNVAGCEAYIDIRSDDPSPVMGKRRQRMLILSPPVDGYICVWEDGSWADKKLASRLSEQLRVETIWLMISSVTDTWGFIVYRNGQQAQIHTEASNEFLHRAGQFAEQHGLPFAFQYFPDTNTSYALDLASANVGEIVDSAEINGDRSSGHEAPNDSRQGSEALPPGFLEMILPCKQRVTMDALSKGANR